MAGSVSALDAISRAQGRMPAPGHLLVGELPENARQWDAWQKEVAARTAADAQKARETQTPIVAAPKPRQPLSPQATEGLWGDEPPRGHVHYSKEWMDENGLMPQDLGPSPPFVANEDPIGDVIKNNTQGDRSFTELMRASQSQGPKGYVAKDARNAPGRPNRPDANTPAEGKPQVAGTSKGGTPVKQVSMPAPEEDAPQRGALPAPPVVAEAKPNAEMPAVPERPAAAQMEPDAVEPDVDPKKQAMKAEMDRRRSMADLRGIHPNTRVFFDKAIAGTEHDQNGDGRLSPDEWADMPALERGRMRREAHDQQRVHTQANYRDHVGTQNMARNEGLSYGHARARLQSGRAAEMIGQGNALMSSPQAEDRMRGRALIAQGEAMKEHADSAIKMHEGLVAQNSSAQNDAFFKSMMMGGANHRNPALGAHVVAAAGGVLEQQAQNGQREADRQVARDRNAVDATNAAADRTQRGEIAGKEHEIALARIDAQIVIADKELAAAKLAKDEARIIDAQRHKDQLELQRRGVELNERGIVLQEQNAADRNAEAAEPKRLHEQLAGMTTAIPVQAGGPSLTEMEQQYTATMNRIPHLTEDQRQLYTQNWNRFVKSHLASRAMAGNGVMRESDWNHLGQMIYQRDTSGRMAPVRPEDFVESVAQHYSGPNPNELRKRMLEFYNWYIAEHDKVTPPPKNNNVGIGTNEAAAFTA